MQLCSAHVDITPRPTAQAGNPQAQPHAPLGPESRALAAHVCVTRVHRKGLRVAPASQPLRDPGVGRSHLCPSTKRMGPEMPSGPFPDVTPDECAPAAWHPSSRALRHCALPGRAGDLAWRRAWGQVPAPVPCLHLTSLHKVLIRPRVQAQPLGLVPARPPPRPRFSYSLTVTLGVGGGEGGRRCGDPASTVRLWVATGQLSLCCLCVPGAGRCGPACLGDQSHSC